MVSVVDGLGWFCIMSLAIGEELNGPLTWTFILSVPYGTLTKFTVRFQSALWANADGTPTTPTKAIIDNTRVRGDFMSSCTLAKDQLQFASHSPFSQWYPSGQLCDWARSSPAIAANAVTNNTMGVDYQIHQFHQNMKVGLPVGWQKTLTWIALYWIAPEAIIGLKVGYQSYSL